MSDHDEERPTRSLHTRRQFLRTSMLGAAAAWTIPVFLERTFGVMDAEAADSAVQTENGRDGRILVVLQLAGGNDGMNCVIPWADDAYYRARPTLGLPADRVLKINDYVGLHPELAGLRNLYDQGHAAIIQGAGYPNPDRSHFRATDIWETASDAQKIETTGWLGRYFDHSCKGADPTVGVSIDSGLPESFAANTPIGVAFTRPEQFRRRGGRGGTEEFERALNAPEASLVPQNANDGGSIGSIQGSNTSPGSNLDFLRRTALEAQMSADKIAEISGKTPAYAGYPKTALADKLSLVGRMIRGGLPTRVYYVSQGGYDTHSGQAGTHDRLLAELGQTVEAFTRDLRDQGNFERVLLMTFSEFGRRVTQNGSGGTDHGAAAPMFIVGGGLKPGLVSKYPSLTELDHGDLVHTVDFRSVYGTVLEKWLRTPSQAVLGRKFPILPFV